MFHLLLSHCKAKVSSIFLNFLTASAAKEIKWGKKGYIPNRRWMRWCIFQVNITSNTRSFDWFSLNINMFFFSFCRWIFPKYLASYYLYSPTRYTFEKYLNPSSNIFMININIDHRNRSYLCCACLKGS